jgi:hypothetical protein
MSQSDNFKGTFYTGDEYIQATIIFAKSLSFTGKFNEQNLDEDIWNFRRW